MNILLAEDTDDLADLIVMLIQTTYHDTKIVWKPNGLDASEEFKSCAGLDEGCGYDFVITDRNMPEMSGLDLAENLNKLDPSIPIVLWTSDNQQQLPPQTAHLFKEVIPKSDIIPWIDTRLKSYF